MSHYPEARSVPMNNTLTTLLKSANVDGAAWERVFCRRAGPPCRSFPHAFESAVRAAGIQGFPFHGLQCTFTRRLVRAGVDFPIVNELRGHQDISMTRRFNHLSHGHKQTAVEKLDNSLHSLHHTRQGRRKAILVRARN